MKVNYNTNQYYSNVAFATFAIIIATCIGKSLFKYKHNNCPEIRIKENLYFGSSICPGICQKDT